MKFTKIIQSKWNLGYLNSFNCNIHVQLKPALWDKFCVQIDSVSDSNHSDTHHIGVTLDRFYCNTYTVL